MLRIGFAGAGFIAGMHAGVLGEQRDVQIAAVFDDDAPRAEAFVQTHGGRAVPSYEALLGESDAVFICTPNVYHANMAIAALQAGRHVFSEKPMGVSPAEARRVHDAVARAQGVYQIGFNKRFANTYVELKRRIDTGALVPRWASMKMNRGELLKPPWVGDASLTGGFLYETPIHLFDLMRWLFGPPREVFCRASPTLDDFAMVFTFQSGLSAAFTTSAHTTWLFPYERVELYGEHAIAATEEMERVTFQLGLDAQPETIDVSALPTAERWGYRAEDEAFLATIRGERATAAGAAEGLAAVELVDACCRSAASGQPVLL